MSWSKVLYERQKQPNGKWMFVPVGYYAKGGRSGFAMVPVLRIDAPSMTLAVYNEAGEYEVTE